MTAIHARFAFPLSSSVFAAPPTTHSTANSSDALLQQSTADTLSTSLQLNSNSSFTSLYTNQHHTTQPHFHTLTPQTLQSSFIQTNPHYSTFIQQHPSLTTATTTNTNITSAVQASNSINTVLNSTASPVNNNNNNNNNTVAASSVSSPVSRPSISQSTNHILLISILNSRIDVTLEHLLSVFNTAGQVRRLIVFTKHNSPKALIEFASVEAAANAKTHFDGVSLFQDACQLKIVYSTLQQLIIKTNTDKARDMTVVGTNGQPLQNNANSIDSLTQQLSNGLNLSNGHSSSATTGYYSQPTPPFLSPQPVHSISDPQGWGTVLLVSNLNPAVVTCDVLWTLFGVYGDVLRVKILYNKRDTAMIQFVDVESSVRAFHALNHLMLAGKQLHISQSKHRAVAMPRPDAESEALHLTRDYSASAAHRFGGKYAPIHIHPPSCVLYVSNIADSLPESQLRSLFQQQCQVKTSKVVVQMFTRYSHSQAFVKMPQLTDAVTALVNLHNAPLLGRQLRVSFANRDPEQVVDTDLQTQPQQGSEMKEVQQQKLDGEGETKLSGHEVAANNTDKEHNEGLVSMKVTN